MKSIRKRTQNMPKTVSVSEAKNKLSAMLRWAVENQDEVVVESHGQPRAVIVPYAEYEMFKQLREREQRKAILERLQKLAEANQALNQDLSAEEAEDLAEEVTRETIDRMETEGKVSFTQS